MKNLERTVQTKNMDVFKRFYTVCDCTFYINLEREVSNSKWVFRTLIIYTHRAL